MLVVFVVVVVMLMGMFLTELAPALITSMNPFVVVVPMAGEPDELVAIVPIARTFIKPPITYLDREPDRVSALLDNHTSGQKSHCKNRKFLFHTYKLFASKRLAGCLMRNKRARMGTTIGFCQTKPDMK